MADARCDSPSQYHLRFGGVAPRALYWVRVWINGLPYAKNICRACASVVRRETPHIKPAPLYAVGQGR